MIFKGPSAQVEYQKYKLGRKKSIIGLAKKNWVKTSTLPCSYARVLLCLLYFMIVIEKNDFSVISLTTGKTVADVKSKFGSNLQLKTEVRAAY